MPTLLATLMLALAGPAEAGMELHLREAIALNRARKERYARLTDGGSDGLFRRLIASEWVLLPVARLVDAQAAPFVAQGIPVVTSDFVPMESVAPFGTPVPPARAMSRADEAAARAILWRLVRRSNDGLEATAQACAQALEELRLLEGEAGLSFPMSRHLVESLGLAALHGLQHNQDSGGETAGLVRRLVGLQRLGLVTLDPVGIDRQANRFHQQGLGIIANEVPAIPFEEEWGRSGRGVSPRR
jgi:hypothetical protein